MNEMINKLNEKINAYKITVFGYKPYISFDPNYTMLPFIYPLYILITNRIITSPISRIS